MIENYLDSIGNLREDLGLHKPALKEDAPEPRAACLLRVLDWYRLEEPLRIKQRTGETVPEGYEYLIRVFVVQLLGIHDYRMLLETHWPYDNPVTDPKTISTFIYYLKTQGLAKIIAQELFTQLSSWQAVLKNKTRENLLTETSSSSHTDPSYLLRVLHHPANPSALAFTLPSWISALIPVADRIADVFISLAYEFYRLSRLVGLQQTTVRQALKRKTTRINRNTLLREKALLLFDHLLRAALRHFNRSTAHLRNTAEAIPSRKTRKLAALMYIRGQIFMNLGRYAEAHDFLRAALAWGSTRKNIIFLIGVAAQLAGRYAEAEQAYRTAIAWGETNAYAFLNLSHVLLALNREQDALPFLERGLRSSVKLSMPHQNFAGQYDHSSYNPQALDMARFPQTMLYDAYNLVGERLIHLGRGEEGAKCFGKALQQQRLLSDIASLPLELKRILERDYQIDSSLPIRILPYEWVTLIGHIAMLDTYRKLQILGMSAPGQALLLAPRSKVANATYLNLWHPHVRIIEDEHLVNFLFPYQRFFGDCFNGYITPEGNARCWTELGAKGQIAWDNTQKYPLIKLPTPIRERGYQELKMFGFKENDWFVALHVRDSGYHKENKYSIQTHRNAELADYFGAIKRITQQGGWVIRMGDVSMKPLPAMERVIDYPHTILKSKWMDIFLAASARFFIGTTSGLTNVVLSFGTPCLLVNCVSNYFQLWNNRVLFTLKPLWIETEKRYMRVSEMTDDRFRWKLFNINRIKELGIIPHANTAVEIEEATIEMFSRLEQGPVMQQTEADQVLRAALLHNHEYFGNGRLSYTFYDRRKKDLL